jgi:hypothetical protein
MKTLAAVLILVVSAAAQSAPKIPDAPSHVRSQWEKKPANVYLSPFKDPFFYAGTMAATSGVLADVHFVQSCERDHTCFEANPGADTYKRACRRSGWSSLGSYGCSLMLHGHRWYRAICAVGPVALGLYHWHDTHITYLRNDRLVRP